MRFYCCLWRFSTPVVAPIRDPIVSAESDIYKLKNTRAEKPISFTSRFFCSQVDVRGLRCDVTRKPFHLTLSKGKQSYLSTGKDFVKSPYTRRSRELNRVPFRTFRKFQNGTSFFFLPQFIPTEKISKPAYVSFEENQMFTFPKNLQSEKEFKITSLGVIVSNRTCFCYLHECCND